MKCTIILLGFEHFILSFKNLIFELLKEMLGEVIKYLAIEQAIIEYFLFESLKDLKIHCVDNNLSLLLKKYFKTKKESTNFISYINTKFVKFLISIKKNKQHVTSIVFQLVPQVPLDREWTDEQLYEYFKLTPEEINFIDSQIPKHY